MKITANRKRYIIAAALTLGVLGGILAASFTSREVIRREGYAYPVTAGLTTAYFPEKTYGDCTFPPGEYEALQIKIGEAEGHNWWCVLYPSLCFVDDTHGVVTEEKKEELKNVLTEEEYDTITDTPRIKITFKWLTH